MNLIPTEFRLSNKLTGLVCKNWIVNFADLKLKLGVK